MKDPFFKYIHELQDSITSKLELIDGTRILISLTVSKRKIMILSDDSRQV